MPALKYAGGAVVTELTSGIDDNDASFAIASSTGWPDGSTGKFVVVLDAGEPTEEKILCATRTGLTVTVDTRGYDGTTAAAHNTGAAAENTFDATSAQRFEDHVYDATDAHAASAITFTPAGDIAATNVQAALAELSSEKATTAAMTAALAAQDTAVFYTEHTWAIPNPAVASGDTDFLIPMRVYVAAGFTKEVAHVYSRLRTGTSVTFSFCGTTFTSTTALTGFSGIVADTTGVITNPADVALADGDYIRPNITAVSGSPKNLMVTVVIKNTVTLS
jgi:hypothetical protein